MEGPKLKNIALLILVLTNLYLLFFVVRLEWQNNVQYRQARTEAIHFLVEKGVAVDERLVPEEITLLPQTVERDLELERHAAAQLLGDGLRMEDRGGGVYRYFGEGGNIQFHSDGSFSAFFTSGSYPLGEEPERTCLDLLSKLDMEASLLEQEEGRWLFCQRWEGVSLFTQQVTLETDGRWVEAITAGRRLVGKPVQDQSRKIITVSTALVEFFNGLNSLGDVCSRVDGIEAGYVTEVSLSGPVSMTPVWRIETDTGAYQLDLVNGQLSRCP